jgi:DNA-binding response OmpR family regulator
MKILLVEDHRVLRDMMADYFADRGFVVDDVGTIEDARVALLTCVYSALVMDLRLPDGDGMDLLRKVPTLVSSGVPILTVTARDSLEDRIAALNEGADDYLVRPFHLKELEARLRAILRRPPLEVHAGRRINGWTVSNSIVDLGGPHADSRYRFRSCQHPLEWRQHHQINHSQRSRGFRLLAPKSYRKAVGRS